MSEKHEIAREDIANLRRMNAQQVARLKRMPLLSESERNDTMLSIFEAHRSIPDLLDIIEYQLGLIDAHRQAAASGGVGEEA